MNDLLNKAQAGDMDAFAVLFEPLRPKIHAVACRYVGPHDAEDVTMDVFIKAWKALPRYGRRATLSTWLIQIARHQAIDRLRAQSAWAGRTDSLEALPPAQLRHMSDPCAPRQLDLLMADEDCQACREALAQLNSKHRDVLLMRFQHEMSYAEIATALDVSIGTVMSRLFHAKRQMRRLISEQERNDRHEIVE